MGHLLHPNCARGFEGEPVTGSWLFRKKTKIAEVTCTIH